MTQDETVRFFEKAVDFTVAEIDRRISALRDSANQELQTLTRLARLVGLNVPALSPSSERLASKLAWAPIAERYLVALIGPLVARSHFAPKNSRSDCQALWKGIDLKQLACQSGLSPSDAPVVQAAVETVLFETPLLQEPTKVDWNGRMYALSRSGDRLIVEG